MNLGKQHHLLDNDTITPPGQRELEAAANFVIRRRPDDFPVLLDMLGLGR